MPDIYSTEWYDALKDLMNRNPDLAKSAPSGELKVLGVFDGDRLVADWRVATHHDLTCDELGIVWRSLFDQAELTHADLAGMIVSLKNSFTPSAIGCSRPNGPTTFGPLRSCIHPMTLRSASVR